jgi:hypothetical protein
MKARSAALSDTTVERVAEILATLADPFAARDTVLASAGLDAATWERMERECTERVQQDTSGALGLIYAEAFARTKAGQFTHERAPQLDHDSRFLSPAQPWRSEAAAVSIEAPGEAPRLLSPSCNDTLPSAQASIAESGLDATAEITLGPRRAVLPFDPPRPACRWLHRFDTQTGLPLLNPIWIDDATADPNKSV